MTYSVRTATLLLIFSLPLALLAQEIQFFDIKSSRGILARMIVDNILSGDYIETDCAWDLHSIYSHLYREYDLAQYNDKKESFFDFENPELLLSQFTKYKIISPKVKEVLETLMKEEEGIHNIANVVLNAALYEILEDEQNRQYIANKFSENYENILGDKKFEAGEFIKGNQNLPDLLLSTDFLTEIPIELIKTNAELKIKLEQFFKTALDPLDISVSINEQGENFIIESPEANYPLPKELFQYDYIDSAKEKLNLTSNDYFYNKLIPFLYQITKDGNFDYTFGILPMSEIFLWKEIGILNEPFGYLNEGFHKLILQSIPKAKMAIGNETPVIDANNGIGCSGILEIKNLLLTRENSYVLYISKENKKKYIEFAQKYHTNIFPNSNSISNLSERLDQAETLSSFVSNSNFCNYTSEDGFEEVIKPDDSISRDIKYYLPELSKKFLIEINLKEIKLENRKISFNYDGQNYSCDNRLHDFLKTINTILIYENNERILYRLPMDFDQKYHVFYLSYEEMTVLNEVFSKTLKSLK